MDALLTQRWRVSKTQTSDPLGVSKTQTLKTQTLWVSRKHRPYGCLENSDPKNSDPLGVSKTQTLKIKQIQRASAKECCKPSCLLFVDT